MVLLSNDGSKRFSVPEWFAQAENYVFKKNPLAFLQKEQKPQKRHESIDFPNMYTYLSTPVMSYEVRFEDEGAKVGQLHYNKNMPTNCNKSCVVFADRFGRKDLASLFNSKNPNDLSDIFNGLNDDYKGGFPGVTKITDKKNLASFLNSYIKNCFVFALQKVPDYYNENLHQMIKGIGHMAPVCGMVDGEIYVCNVGDLRRWGTIELTKEAFADDFKLIDLYVVNLL